MAAVRHVRRAPYRRNGASVRLVGPRGLRTIEAVFSFGRPNSGQRGRRNQHGAARCDRHFQWRRIVAGAKGSRKARASFRARPPLMKAKALPDRRGYFGEFGGKYVPETLMAALDEFESAYRKLRRDKSFARALDALLANYVGRPTPLSDALRFGELCGDFKLFLKREDLNHTGAH